MTSLVIISGGSRGFGRALAILWASKLCPSSTMILLSRSVSGLERTRYLVLSLSPNLKVLTISMDFERENEYLFFKIFHETLKSSYETVYLFHNSGSMDPQNGIPLLQRENSFQEFSTYFNSNFYSLHELNINVLPSLLENSKMIFVVNISSLAALEAFPTWGLYCSAKSCRDSYFRVLALEYPKLRVLNYAPGPMDTQMTQKLLKDSMTPKEILKGFERGFVKVEDSAKKLYKLLSTNQFVSGSHVDYFDE